MKKRWIGLAAVLVMAACGGDDDERAQRNGAGGEDTTATAMPGDDHGHGAGGHGGAKADCSPSGTALTVVAKDTAFDQECLAAPANEDFKITLDNQDAKPHNLVLLESHTATDVFARMEIFTGPKQETMEVTKLRAGTYAFHCEVHPDEMSGTFVVK